jgi:hypothetical protein
MCVEAVAMGMDDYYVNGKLVRSIDDVVAMNEEMEVIHEGLVVKCVLLLSEWLLLVQGTEGCIFSCLNLLLYGNSGFIFQSY